jgi:RNA polymerase sigma-70 factor (ECF subfamily)
VEAEDIVQDAMLRALKALDGFRGTDAKPWLLAIVRNCCRTVASRSRGRAAFSLDDAESSGTFMDAFTSQDPTPEAVAIDRERNQTINEAIARLPDEFREVLILRELEELSYREIAEIAKLPIGTVMSRLSRARTMLKERWLEREEAL